MRVITGLARGRKLKEPEGVAIRPTSDMVKESIFNIIQYDVEGEACSTSCWDRAAWYRGLSRGAATVTFVDESASAIKLVKENLRRSSGGKTVLGDALKFLEHPGKFDLIFIDPPYDRLMNKRYKRFSSLTN